MEATITPCLLANNNSIFKSGIYMSWSRIGWGTGTIASLGRRVSVSNAKAISEAMSISNSRVIDTADSYGSGDAEVFLGHLLSGSRTAYTVITKVGYRYCDWGRQLFGLNQVLKKALPIVLKKQCFDTEYVRKAIPKSLERLQMQHVYAILLHDPDRAAVMNKKLWKLLCDFKKEKKVNQIGISSCNADVIQAAMDHAQLDVLQTPAYIEKAIELQHLWKKCETRGIHVVGNHIFPPKYTQDIGLSHKTLAHATTSLAPSSATLLTGTRNPRHLCEFSEWISNPCDDSEVENILRIIKSN